MPGYIGYSLAKALRINSEIDKQEQQWVSLINIFVFTLCCYVIYDLLERYLIKNNRSILDAFYISGYRLTIEDIIILFSISSILGLIYALLSNQEILYKIFKRLKITKNISKCDLWSGFVKDRDCPWVIFRDYVNGLTYDGYIKKYSGTNQKRELMLADVIVYDTQTSKELYRSKYILFIKKR